MTEVLFAYAIAVVLRWEGYITNDPNDLGGYTIYGISAKYHPDHVHAMKLLESKEDQKKYAMDIYYKEYWLKAKCNELPPALAILVFDSAVNQGVGAATRYLQIAVGAKPDGIIGPKTRAKIASINEGKALKKLAQIRTMAYTKAKTWKFHGAGWTNRIFDTYQKAYAYKISTDMNELLRING